MICVRNWHAACSSDVHSGKENYEELAVAYYDPYREISNHAKAALCALFT